MDGAPPWALAVCPGLPGRVGMAEWAWQSGHGTRPSASLIKQGPTPTTPPALTEHPTTNPIA